VNLLKDFKEGRLAPGVTNKQVSVGGTMEVAVCDELNDESSVCGVSAVMGGPEDKAGGSCGEEG